MSVLLQLGACHDGIDLEVVTAFTTAPNPRPRIAPPSPTLSPQELPPTQLSRPLNPDAPPVQLQAVSLEQYTACVHMMRVPRFTCLIYFFRLQAHATAVDAVGHVCTAVRFHVFLSGSANEQHRLRRVGQRNTDCGIRCAGAAVALLLPCTALMVPV